MVKKTLTGISYTAQVAAKNKPTPAAVIPKPVKSSAAKAVVAAFRGTNGKPTNVPFPEVMIDLETCDTTARSAILSIGAVRFNEKDFSGETFYRAITVQSNIDAGRTISGKTLAWHMEQESAVRNVFNDPKAVPLAQALQELREFIGEPLVAKNTKVWGKGAVFDIAILNDAYAYVMKMSPPWEFWNIKCFRTVGESAFGRKVAKPENSLAHNALADAIAQAEHLQMIWEAGYPQ